MPLLRTSLVFLLPLPHWGLLGCVSTVANGTCCSFSLLLEESRDSTLCYFALLFLLRLCKVTYLFSEMTFCFFWDCGFIIDSLFLTMSIFDLLSVSLFSSSFRNPALACQWDWKDCWFTTSNEGSCITWNWWFNNPMLRLSINDTFLLWIRDLPKYTLPLPFPSLY